MSQCPFSSVSRSSPLQPRAKRRHLRLGRLRILNHARVPGRGDPTRAPPTAPTPSPYGSGDRMGDGGSGMGSMGSMDMAEHRDGQLWQRGWQQSTTASLGAWRTSVGGTSRLDRVAAFLRHASTRLVAGVAATVMLPPSPEG